MSIGLVEFSLRFTTDLLLDIELLVGFDGGNDIFDSDDFVFFACLEFNLVSIARSVFVTNMVSKSESTPFIWISFCLCDIL